MLPYLLQLSIFTTIVNFAVIEVNIYKPCELNNYFLSRNFDIFSSAFIFLPNCSEFSLLIEIDSKFFNINNMKFSKIVRGNFNQAHNMFEQSAGKQCVNNSLFSI